MLICVAGICFGIYKFVSRNFEAHVRMCTLLPKFANYGGGGRVNDASIAQLIQRDEFAYREFTRSFSEPIRVSILDNGALLFLTRVWKANDGYLTLTSGRDPRGLLFFIGHTSEIPRMSKMSKQFEKVVKMTTVTKAFLEDYEVVMTPIGPKGLHVYQTESSYSLNGVRVEQDLPSDGHKPSSHVPSDGPTAPADAH